MRSMPLWRAVWMMHAGGNSARPTPGAIHPNPFETLNEHHMKYMLLIYNEEKAWGKFTEAQRQGFMGEFMKFTQQIQSAGQWLSSSQLQPTSVATSVRERRHCRGAPARRAPSSGHRVAPRQMGGATRVASLPVSGVCFFIQPKQ